ncbi:MAG: hypothetical protein ACLFQX_04155 [Candidatus Kapaibacterium sp.]
MREFKLLMIDENGDYVPNITAKHKKSEEDGSPYKEFTVLVRNPSYRLRSHWLGHYNEYLDNIKKLDEEYPRLVPPAEVDQSSEAEMEAWAKSKMNDYEFNREMLEKGARQNDLAYFYNINLFKKMIDARRLPGELQEQIGQAPDEPFWIAQDIDAIKGVIDNVLFRIKRGTRAGQ